MKTIGLLGGMTYQSTAVYYTLINSHVQRALGGPSSASLILHSFNHAEMTALFAAGDWDAVADKFTAAEGHLRAAGAQCLAIACNAGHKVAGQVAARGELPVLHVADFTARVVREKGFKRVGLLGTRTAMEDGFIQGPLEEGAGVEVLVPILEDRVAINKAIIDEIGAGVFTDETKALMAQVVDRLVEQGAEGIVLACTDLQFVLKQENVAVPLLDTMEIHAKGLSEWSLAE